MLRTFGARHVLETITLVCYDHQGPSGLKSPAALRAAYRRLLGAIQPDVPRPEGDAMEFVTDLASPRARRLAEVFNTDLLLNDNKHVVGSSGNDRLQGGRVPQERAEAVLREQIAAFGERDRAFGYVLPIVTHTVLAAPCPTAFGGTTSAAIGVLWMDPRSGWEDADYAELLAHETTHTLLFLDELRFCHYLDPRAMARRESWVMSAIRGVPRPLDKVVHSIVVSHEILALRDDLLKREGPSAVHPSSATLLASTRCAIDEVLAVRREGACIAPRCFELVEVTRDHLRSRFGARAA